VNRLLNRGIDVNAVAEFLERLITGALSIRALTILPRLAASTRRAAWPWTMLVDRAFGIGLRVENRTASTCTALLAACGGIVPVARCAACIARIAFSGRTALALSWLVSAGRTLRWIARVVALVEHPETTADLPLDIRGTAFQERVWRALQAIPPGATASYAALAECIGAKGAARAVAGACAANRLAVAVPCHRVVRGDGALSGYAWGVDRKRELLARETAAAENKP